jgi:hypothetical protein
MPKCQSENWSLILPHKITLLSLKDVDDVPGSFLTQFALNDCFFHYNLRAKRNIEKLAQGLDRLPDKI